MSSIKYVALALVCLGLAVSVSSLEVESHASASFTADPHFAAFMDYTVKFNKKYRSIEEFAMRMENFKASKERVAKLNHESGNRNIYGLTKFSDMSQEEFKNTMLTYRSTGMHKDFPVGNLTSNRLSIPTSLDWRDQGKVTPVKDQMQCGSCWAFSATEAIESGWLMADKPQYILSPQQIVACDTYDGGCKGGQPYRAYKYVQETGGMEQDADYPYTSGNGQVAPCTADRSKFVVSISGWENALTPCTYGSCTSQDENQLKAMLASKGPLSVCVNATPWQDYTSGVMSTGCSSDASSIDHCVQLVGYTSSYWIVRNSWNTDWGNGGFIYLGIGSNVCGIADQVTYVTV